MSNPAKLPDGLGGGLSLEYLAEIICAAEIAGDSARLAQGEAALVAAQSFGWGCYTQLARLANVPAKTLAERARVVEFYSGDDVTVGTSFARTMLESHEGVVTWTKLREAKALRDRELAVSALEQAVEQVMTPAEWHRYLRKLQREQGRKQRKWVIEDPARRVRITIEHL